MTQTVAGDLASPYVWGGSSVKPVVSGTIEAALVEGNGFSSTLLVTGCSDGVTCRGDGGIGGVFYDADAAVLAGLVNMNLEIDDLPRPLGGSDAHNVSSVGYFTLDQQ